MRQLYAYYNNSQMHFCKNAKAFVKLVFIKLGYIIQCVLKNKMEVMTMSEKQPNEQVEAFLNKESQWQEEYKYLRALIFNETELEEAYKWMHPCYTLNNKNVVLIHGFKIMLHYYFIKVPFWRINIIHSFNRLKRCKQLVSYDLKI